MGWVKPIDQVDADIRRVGIFMLVDVDGKKLRFFGFKKDYTDINRAMDSLKGRSQEMVKYLIEVASARSQRGETK
jgi:hypothetical protein